MYQNTSLAKVRDGVCGARRVIDALIHVLEETHAQAEAEAHAQAQAQARVEVEDAVVYGELVIDDARMGYGSRERHALNRGDWTVFGVVVSLSQHDSSSVQNAARDLHRAGFLAKRDADARIVIFMNPRLERLANDCGLGTPQKLSLDDPHDESCDSLHELVRWLGDRMKDPAFSSGT